MGVLPTIGFNVETITTNKKKQLTIWDIGGDIRIRRLWKHYLGGAPGHGRVPVWVIDASDPEKFLESQIELWKILMKYEPPFILVYANKQDKIASFSTETIAAALKLYNLDIPWHVVPCCASCGQGLWEGIDYFESRPAGPFSFKSRPPINCCHLLLLGWRCKDSIFSLLPPELVLSLVSLISQRRDVPFCYCGPRKGNNSLNSPFLYENGPYHELNGPSNRQSTI